MYARTEKDQQRIDIDIANRQAVVGADVPVGELRAAAARAGLRYPYRPADPAMTVGAQLRRSATCFGAWLRHGAPFRAVAEVGVVDDRGHQTVLVRDERLGTVQREFVAALRAGRELTHVVVDLAMPDACSTSMIVSFDDRLAAARAAQSVIALGRPTSVDVLDETAMVVLAGFGGLGMYPTGTALFVELAGAERAGLAQDIARVEDLCFAMGATSIRSSDGDVDLAAALDTLVVSVRPVLRSIGFRRVHEAVVPAADLPVFVDGVCAVEKLHHRLLTVMVEGATSTVTCWTLPTVGDEEVAAIATAVDRLAAVAGAVLLDG